jgi:hypothetical protein
MASRSRQYGRSATIAVCTAATTSPASAPIIVKPRMRSSFAPTIALMRPCFSPVACARNTALVGSLATRVMMPWRSASRSLSPTWASGGSVRERAKRATRFTPSPVGSEPRTSERRRHGGGHRGPGDRACQAGATFPGPCGGRCESGTSTRSDEIAERILRDVPGFDQSDGRSLRIRHALAQHAPRIDRPRTRDLALTPRLSGETSHGLSIVDAPGKPAT